MRPKVFAAMMVGATWVGTVPVAAAQAIAGQARFGVMTPMRDGVRLASNIWTPADTGRYPTILIRTPYLKTAQFRRYGLANYLERGYSVVLQDTRGRGDSEGDFDFYAPEGLDGYDTIEWIAAQPWSNGRVGMDGGSYLGTVQWLAAREHPPSLACIAPTAASGRIFDELPYLGGAFRMEWALPWLNSVAGHVAQDELAGLVDWGRISRHRPLGTMDAAFGRPMRLYREFLEHPTFDDYWRRIAFTAQDFAAIDIPSLTVTGWFDGDQAGALSYWDGLERHNDRRENRFLIIGPWTHAMTYLGGDKKVGEIPTPPGSVLEIQNIRLAFFDWCLKRASPRFEQPPVQAYLTGADRWVTADRYPLPAVETTEFFLHSGGQANSLRGDGSLSTDPAAREAPDTFTYDPRQPAPSRDPAADHRDIEARADVLVYTTDPLTRPVDILGRVFVRIFAASDAKDTDFTAKLLDVGPDGRAILLGPSATGVKRARYRLGYDREVFLTPNRAEEYEIELFDIGYRFGAEHRIRVEISSSAFPFINPNPNTGLPIATDTTWRVARQTVYHDAGRRSRLLLPVLPSHEP